MSDNEAVRCYTRDELLNRAVSSDSPPGGGAHPYRSVAIGAAHACRADRASAERRVAPFACWGDNQFGQLGDGTTERRDSPVAVDVRNVMVVAAGGWHTCAIASERGDPVYCWGRNDQGQLGFASTDTCATDHGAVPCTKRPQRVLGITGASSLLLGDDYTCAQSLAGLSCWGRLQVARPDFGMRSSLTPEASCFAADPRSEPSEWKTAIRCSGNLPTPPLGGVAMVRVRTDGAATSACALRWNDRSIWCWGAPGSAYAALSAKSGSPAMPLRVHVSAPAHPDAAVIDLWPTGASPADPGKTAGVPDEAHADVERSWSPDCLIHRACPKPTTALPRCFATLQAVPWDELRRQTELYLGKTVSVSGSLRVSPAIGETAVGCPADHCCNDSSTHFILASGNVAHSLSLRVRGKDPDQCVGDDSRLCCEHPATGQLVVATGVLQVDPSRRWEPRGYTISRPDLCELVP
jgi:hypothetical protein